MYVIMALFIIHDGKTYIDSSYSYMFYIMYHIISLCILNNTIDRKCIEKYFYGIE